jgi:hypothetical protein
VSPDEFDECSLALEIKRYDRPVVIALCPEDNTLCIQNRGRWVRVDNILHFRPSRIAKRPVQLADRAIRVGVHLAEPKQGVAIEHVHVLISPPARSSQSHDGATAPCRVSSIEKRNAAKGPRGSSACNQH